LNRYRILRGTCRDETVVAHLVVGGRRTILSCVTDSVKDCLHPWSSVRILGIRRGYVAVINGLWVDDVDHAFSVFLFTADAELGIVDWQFNRVRAEVPVAMSMGL
jgi:hypothetical protein